VSPIVQWKVTSCGGEVLTLVDTARAEFLLSRTGEEAYKILNEAYYSQWFNVNSAAFDMVNYPKSVDCKVNEYALYLKNSNGEHTPYDYKAMLDAKVLAAQTAQDAAADKKQELDDAQADYDSKLEASADATAYADGKIQLKTDSKAAYDAKVAELAALVVLDTAKEAEVAAA
jgi:hypothetical protein